jgi:F0F1-type ATP synthase assembly protein I
MNPLSPVDGENSQRKSWTQTFGPYLTMGMELAIAVVGMFFIGRWLDGVFRTAPWLMITGLLMGVTGGFIRFFRKAIAMGKAADRATTKERSERRHED